MLIRGCLRLAVLTVLLLPASARAEVILQYFNLSWRDLAAKMPELAEVGYGSLWLPPPTKASGGLSVGYDLWDPFDLGGRDQRNTVKTRYGTEAELLELIRVAHRFGIRVYFDNIMNHRAFDVPGFNEFTPIDIYPGMVPEDFHLRVTEDGFYRKWDNVSDWNDAWQVQNRNFSDLIDIAQETPNANFGFTEGSTHPKISLVRHPNNPEWYDFHPTLGRVGFHNTNITAGVIAANENFYKEDVGAYLMRALRWLVDRTKLDGLRLDAVKHVPSYFFGDQGAGKDTSNAGYTGQAQEQFNITRGFSDPNHRDSVFNLDQARDDLMIFGEHLGAPPGFGEYIDAGMRLIDAPLHSLLNNVLGNPSASLAGLDQPGFSGNPNFNQNTGVMFAKSHDDDFANRPELHYALHLTRAGIANIYTDGNYQSETLAQSGGAFPRHANTAFLGQFGDVRIPNLVYIHEQFARSQQIPKWSDSDVVAYERRDKRENGAMTDEDGTVMLFMMNDNFSAGQGRPIATTFGSTPFVNDAYLHNYSSYGGPFYVWGSQIANGSVIIPPGGYFVFSWRTPEESDLWRVAGGKPITIYENGNQAGTVTVTRRDGPDGDPNFNPYFLPNRGYPTNQTPAPFTYRYTMPRVTSSTNLRFVTRVDGSAVNVLMKLDGGVDINSHMGLGPTNDSYAVAKRDNRPGINPLEGTELFLGYEQVRFKHRQHEEKFAAKDSSRNKIGSAGAETYIMTIGTSGFVTNIGNGVNNWSDAEGARWVYHDPFDNVTGGTNSGQQFRPPPQSAAGSNVVIWAKVGYACDIGRAFIYYTTDGVSFPEGAGGEGVGNTKVAVMNFHHNDSNDGTGVPDWWRGVLPPMTNGTVLRYKIGVYREQGAGCGAPFLVQFPSDPGAVALKKTRMGVWEVTNFNAATVVYKPHNDYGASVTGLVEGFHVLRARAFLERENRASLYNTFVQSFYYDAKTPEGQIVFPASNGDNLPSQEYGLVIRTDPTVTEVWYNIEDSNPLNDDGQTGVNDGNGTNLLGQASWARANRVVPSLNINNPHPDEWRFTYRNIPASGSATIYVKLLEISSSTNLNLSDSAGHYTTLTRTVNTLAPTQAVFVAFPPNNGDVVDSNYVAKVYFSKSLADGTNEETLKARFAVRINGSAQSPSIYSIAYDETPTYHALAIQLPNLFNGDPNFLHNLEITHTTAGNVVLQASRLVRAAPAVLGPYVAIVSPPEVDSVGRPFVITLPDVASPTPEQRQFTILVESDLAASNVWVEFLNNAGTATLLSAVENQLAGRVDVTAASTAVVGRDAQISGTVSVTISNTVVTGTGTAFLTHVKPGNRLRISTNTVIVASIESNTSLTLTAPYPGATGSGLSAFVRPSFDWELQPGQQFKVGTNEAVVALVSSPSNMTLTAGFTGATATNQIGYRIDPNPSQNGNRLRWSLLWTNMTGGFFTFYANVDTDNDTNTVEAVATRNVRVQLRQIVDDNPNSDDDDNDGLSDLDETTIVPLPGGNPESWSNGDVHRHFFSGRTDPLSPDTDGDGIPDATELGLGSAIANDTDLNADTNGDGFKNFIADAHPPLFNTTDNWWHPRYDLTRPRTDLLQGTMTDPTNPDTDFDGLMDGMEDLNRNGRLEIGLLNGSGVVTGIIANPPTIRATSRIDRDAIPSNAVMLETDPNNPDTDGDGLPDGQEDVNGNGMVDIGLVTGGVTNILTYTQLPLYGTNINGVISRAINRALLTNWYNAADLRWFETDPLNPDTDGDGLPDGWEVQYGLDPLDNGIINLRTGGPGNPDMGASGDPDGDGFDNLTEFLNGTHPLVPNNVPPPPEGSIVIGRGPVIGVINGVTNHQEFMDWTWDDLLALDPYDGDGSNNQQGDIYMAFDGWDTSRDMVAFYARDGGPVDGKLYFRVDFHDLQPFAEQANLDIYVVIDIGSPGAGERVLPDDVDTLTDMRWEAVVAVYDSASGRVYVDTNPGLNSTLLGQDLSSFGVVIQPGAFLGAYFNSELDAVEFAIDRTALTGIGWNGIFSNLNFQVFTTKDGTCNSCINGGPGAGDIGGRSDIRDAIYNDYIAENYWQAQPGLAGANSVLKFWIPASASAGRAKVSSIIHGNQTIQPGSTTMNLINNGFGAGYHRPLLAHQTFSRPFNLHVTPTLASAIQWASVDTNAGPIWRDGPLFNKWIADLSATGIVYFMGSTFSDHVIPYFSSAYNQDNAELSREFLEHIYDVNFSTNAIFWTPERVLDGATFQQISGMGYKYTVLDQMLHLRNWFGRQTALGNDGYRINRIHGVNTFAINDQANGFRFVSHDNGLNMSMRRLLSRKARSGVQDQVVVLMSNWEDFGNISQANSYDLNVRWLANRPWTHVVALEQIAAGEVDLNGDGNGDSWFVIDRGSPAIAKVAHDWVHHATQLNYDNWYFGSANEEGLAGKVFEIRSGTNVFKPFGQIETGGVVSDAWYKVTSVADTNLARLARSVKHASTFQTAFHNQQNNDLRKFSTGDYINPDTDFNTLAFFSKNAQSQSRKSAIYASVDLWAGFAASVTTPQVTTLDVDLDGEDEYILYNDRLYAIFERIGGRMVAAWVRNVLDGRVYQVVGNQAGYSGSETEWEGDISVQTNGTIVAFRTSGLKDWYATKGGGTTAYNNSLYNFVNWTNGWRITSADGEIRKTVTLAPQGSAFNVKYDFFGAMTNQTLYVRNGLSPNLFDLLLNGQKTLGRESHAAGMMSLANTNYHTTVRAFIPYATGGFNANFNTNAVDDNPAFGVDFQTVKMRNQAQTHQVELFGTNGFSFALGFTASLSDWDGDGIPNIVEDQLPFLDPLNPLDGLLDEDGDGVLNWEEYIMGTDMQNANSFLRFTQQMATNGSGVMISFPTEQLRNYWIWYLNNGLISPSWLPATTSAIPGTGMNVDWLDDGTATTPHPFAVTNRVYKIEVNLP